MEEAGAGVEAVDVGEAGIVVADEVITNSSSNNISSSSKAETMLGVGEILLKMGETPHRTTAGKAQTLKALLRLSRKVRANVKRKLLVFTSTTTVLIEGNGVAPSTRVLDCVEVVEAETEVAQYAVAQVFQFANSLRLEFL